MLELVGLEGVHDLSADSACTGLGVRVSLGQRGVLHVGLDFHVVFFLFVGAGCELEGKLDIVSELLLVGVDDFVYVELHGLGLQLGPFALVVLILVVGVSDSGERSLAVSLVLFGSDALVLDDVAEPDDYFDDLDEGEQHQEDKRDEKLDEQVGVEHHEQGPQNNVPEEKLGHVYHLDDLPSVLQIGVLAPHLRVQPLRPP